MHLDSARHCRERNDTVDWKMGRLGKHKVPMGERKREVRFSHKTAQEDDTHTIPLTVLLANREKGKSVLSSISYSTRLESSGLDTKG